MPTARPYTQRAARRPRPIPQSVSGHKLRSVPGDPRAGVPNEPPLYVCSAQPNAGDPSQTRRNTTREGPATHLVFLTMPNPKAGA
jgi:hypothetical protein